MNLQVKRHTLTPTSTLGDLYIDGKFFCRTLERPDVAQPGVTGAVCIPPGIYGGSIAYFPHIKENAPLLSGTEPRTGIFIHIGNYPKDSIGCILVGLSQSRDFVGNSKEAFERLMAKIGKEPFTVEIAAVTAHAAA
jgi:hypothetical protein